MLVLDYFNRDLFLDSFEFKVDQIFRHDLTLLLTIFEPKNCIICRRKNIYYQPRETLATVGPIPRHPERVVVVASFRLTTGHDFLEVYLHWLGMAANDTCSHCGHARMDGDHLPQCTGLSEYPADGISRYWEAGRQMVKKQSTGIG
ncbi:reverse transcriptase [Trichonephila clavipes]|nr:reverse transcriptase [Trichonephila clavipes]